LDKQIRRMIVRTLLAVLLLVPGLGFGPAVHAEQPSEDHDPHLVKIGAVLPLTGELASKGEQVKTALTLSTREANAFLTAAGRPFRLGIEIRDSEGRADKALAHAQDLHAEGVFLLIAGSSAEVQAIKPWSDANDAIVISYSSSAPTLAEENDSVFRMVPDDRQQAEVLAELIASLDVSAIIPVYRNDAYGRDMAALVAERFPQESPDGKVLEAVAYEPQTRDFAEVVRKIAERIDASGIPRDKTAVVLVAFEEATLLFEAAGALQDIRWFGTETLALNTSFHQSGEALAFAEKVGFAAVSYGFTETAYYLDVKQRIEEELGRVAMPNTIYAYDIPWLIADLLPELEQPDDPGEWKRRFVELSQAFIGATGVIMLNEAGDRKFADFDVWQIREESGGHYWVKIAEHVRDPGVEGHLVWMPGYEPPGQAGRRFWLGFNPHAYNPLNLVYRDEFIYMLMHAIGAAESEDNGEADLPFVDADHIDIRAVGSVKQAFRQGIAAGYPDQTLKPHYPITRAEMIAMVGRALGGAPADGRLSIGQYYRDANQIPAWAEEGTALLTAREMLGIAEGEELAPHEPVTLAEAAAVILLVMAGTD